MNPVHMSPVSNSGLSPDEVLKGAVWCSFFPTRSTVRTQVLYTRPIVTLCDTFKVAKHLALEDPDDLDEEWLLKGLGLP